MTQHTLKDTLVLYHYFRSSSSWRVRWALAYKGIAYQSVNVDLLRGEQRQPEHLERNPMAAVPVLYTGGVYLAESVAILEYLNELAPSPPLLPEAPHERARVRQLVQLIAADIQPLQNLSVLEFAQQIGSEPDMKQKWAQRFIRRGFDAYETLLGQADWPSGPYSYGTAVTMADLCLVPQCYNARRQGLILDEWPRIAAIEAACLTTEAAKHAHPDRWKPT